MHQLSIIFVVALEDHLNMCSLQAAINDYCSCDFSYAGCNEKLQRQDMERYIEVSGEVLWPDDLVSWVVGTHIRNTVQVTLPESTPVEVQPSGVNIIHDLGLVGGD